MVSSIIQCDKEMSIIDVCRKVARERNARTVLRFAPKTGHQSNGFVEAVHGHIQGPRTTLPDTNWDEHWRTTFSNFTYHSICNSLRWICSLKIHSATRRQNTIPPYVSPLCMFGESVFALIPDHEVRAAKLTNRWISGCWRGTRCIVRRTLGGDETWIVFCADQFAEKPPEEQWSRRETIEARGTKWNF